jgi:ABC-type transporter Mla MlaB component
VIRIEETPQGGLRVIGALERAALSGLLETRSSTEVVLDLSEVREADAAAVHMLAQLPPRCRLVNCPRWLALWIERERQLQNSDIVAP